MAAAQGFPAGLRRVLLGALASLGLVATVLLLLLVTAGDAKAAPLRDDASSAAVAPQSTSARDPRPPGPRPHPDAAARPRLAPAADAPVVSPIASPPPVEPVAPAPAPVLPTTEAAVAPAVDAIPVPTDGAPSLSPPASAPPAPLVTTATPVTAALSTATPSGSERLDLAAVEPSIGSVAKSVPEPTASTTGSKTASTTAPATSTTVARAVSDDTGRVTKTTVSMVAAVAGGDEALSRSRDPGPIRVDTPRTTLASPMHIAAPSDPPIVPAVPQTPTVPAPPPVPPPPAPVAPTNAPRTGGSGSSSNDASRALQLLLYAVGATIASLVLARGRYVLTLPARATRLGFVPIIERPG